MNWYLKAFKQYFDFSGRARRKEFWMFALFHFLFIFVTTFLVFFLTSDIYEDTEINYLISIIPSIALTVRRLHDTGKSGWLYLLVIIPYLGWFIIIIFACMEGNRGTNKWGPNPKGIGSDSMINQIGKE
ncbi:UNVERIFIED_CONTAM: hypothetical protein GTU68_024641 [Idotea baltica]|nr:hypothetical protein [Idotea baltica]